MDALPGNSTDLALRAQGGDRAAFEQLYERVAPALFAWIELRLRRGATRLDPEDVLQEVWFRAFDRFESYDASRGFRRWIFGIAKNVLLQNYERLRSEPGSHALVSSASGSVALPDTLTTASSRLCKDEALLRFIDYVSALDADDQTLLVYCGLEEYTCAEAAVRLGISVEATAKRWQALRARLRQSGVLEKLASALID
jgi:RNA polymerase sigma-70 factor (ECF subfamily)